MRNIKNLLRDTLDDGDSRELFEYLLEADEIATAESEMITRRKDRQTAPLSFAQQRLWFLEQMEPGTSAYNIAGALHLKGKVSLAALDRSFNEILLRHEAVRTSFADTDGKPVQLINPPSTIRIPLIDLSELPVEKREVEARELSRGEARRGFDLTKAPLLRVKMLRLEQDEHMLVVILHHIISDGWSIGVLIKEMAELYESLSNGEGSPLPDLTIQYADFAAWQRERLQGEVLEAQLAYWKTQLRSDLPSLSLPTNRPRPAVQTYRGASATLRLGKQVSEQLKELSRREGVTLFMSLMAAFDILLYRYTGQEEITVGTIIANRNRREIEGLIGFFANTLVMKVDLSREPSFQEAIQRAKQTALGAYEHQDLPFEKLVEELKPERNLSHSALFQVMFTLQGDWMPVIELPDITMTPLEIESDNSKFDLALEMHDGLDGLRATLEYSADLFDRATIERMLQHFELLLEAVVANPDQVISTLPILKPAEQQQLLVQWNQTSKEFPTDKCIHQIFEEQVRRAPHRVAFVYERERMSYEELNRRANQVARVLRRAGVGPDVTVGICMERGVEMIVGLMGILKAGGAYVPLDPTYPADRLRFMLEDSSARALIAQEQFAKVFPALDMPVICLDTGWSEIAKESGQDLVNQSPLASLVYIIYTSGSTGVPKGVLVPHGGVLNCLLWMQAAYQLNETDRVLFKSPLSFDASVWELFWPLMVGASVVVARPGGHQDSFYIAKLLSGEKVTIAHFVPSMLSLFLEEEGIEQLDSLRLVVCGGEALAPEALQRAFRRLGAEIHNFYGPTETSIGSIDWTCEPQDAEWVVPIGRPIANTEIYILNNRLLPAPIGVAGELCTGGAGLARGYLNRADLTAESFLPDPFGSGPGGRLYKSGDLARLRADGNIEFLGRIDQQVKVRGFRIELGEIETVLKQHENVREAVAVAREDGPGDKRLVAYVVQADGVKISASDLRNLLREKLPDYMVPSAFVVIDEIPLTSNGKVDRRALPAPDAGLFSVECNYVAPRSPLEELLSGIWTEVLGVSRIGVHDNFFDLGGHSLLATQVTSRIRTATLQDISVRRLFERPAIALLAEFIEAQMNASRALQSIPLARSSRDEKLPLSFSQQRLWFLDQFEANKSVYNMAAMKRLEGKIDIAALEQALSELARRHEILRTTFAMSGAEPIQIINPPEPVSLPLIDLSGQPEDARMEHLQKLATREVQRSFDLSKGPLLRAMLLRLAEDDHALLLIIHHIIWDGWSVGILTRELRALYKAFVKGEESPLPELDIQYADFTRWQRQWLRGELLESQFAYWKRQLGGSAQALELPADYARSPVQSYRGATYNFVLSTDLLQDIKALGRREGVTLFMTLLAAFQSLLYRYTRQEDISVGSPIANRNLPALEGLIGFFVNTLVMRVSFAGDPTFSEMLSRVREAAFGAYAHQDLPFEMLVEQIQPTRDLSHSPLFQVLFALQNAPYQELELEGLKLSHIDLDTGMSHFDLTLSMAEEAEGLIGSLEYNTDLFEAATIRRLAAHFEVLLKQVTHDPKRLVTDLSIIPESERHQLLVEWNNIQADSADQPCLHEMFEQQAERTPHETAVEFEGERLSYRELNARANQLASYLRGLGAGPDVLIGICLPRSIEMITGLIAILKSGAAFVPLDPSYPKQRLAFMLEDAHLVLTQKPLLDSFPSSNAELVCLDSEIAEITSRSIENPIGKATSDNLAYVVYTSGSTGRPKGVAMSHGAISSMTRWQIESSKAAVGTRTLQFASLSFDVSFQEIFSTLSSGGTVVLISEETRRDDKKLMRFLTEAGIGRLFVPFVMLRQLGERAETCEALPASLQEVMTAGEQLKITPEIESLFSKLPHCALYNHYGPSETHAATSFTLVGLARNWPRLPSIGYRVPHAQVYVLDERLHLVPIGVSGELYIGGAGLARGYLNRADLTAESFLPDPFGSGPGGRLYKSGDLARLRADGNIEFLGRIDQQVKIRGFRIELGEIETVLKQHENVREAVAVACEKPGQKRLAAYVVLDGRASVSTSELRAHLKQSLPEYMIPSAFIKLSELPLTASGKVNRRALPSPDSAIQESGEDYVAARNPVEVVLAAIWAEVLDAERVSVTDNFFDLGGHSLLATQLTSRLQEAFEVEVPLRRLFECPTVESLSEFITEAVQAGIHLNAPPLERVSRDNPLPLSFAQQRLWFLNYVDPGNIAYNMPAALRMEGAVDLKALEESFAQIIRRHEVLRTSFTTAEGIPAQVINPLANFHLPLVDLSGLPRAEREIASRALAIEEAQQPFDLTEAPLLRVKLLRLDEQDHVLLVTMHHIVSDGWSIGIIIRELAAIYEAQLRGEPPTLPELAIQYADFAVWQREWLKGEVLDRQLDYWKQQLGGKTPTLMLPTDRPRQAVQTFQGASVSFSVPRDVSDKLSNLARREGATLFMSLLAAFQILLHRYSGQQDITVGTPIANRGRRELEGLIGFFVNTLVIRTDLRRTLTYRELIRRVREITLSGYAHQDVTFEKLVEELQPERDLSHSPLFQVAFALQNAPVPRLELSGLVLSPLETESVTTKFDLVFSMEEKEQELQGVAEYNIDLFDRTTIERMTKHFSVLLQAVAANPDQDIHRLQMLTSAEQRQLLEEWNLTATDYPSDKRIHQLFEEQVERAPDAVAVIFEGEHTSYRDLNNQANRVAHYLLRLGIDRGATVSVFLGRSLRMVVSVLGVIKAGAAYVPIDVSWPQERILSVLSSLDISCMLTEYAQLRIIHDLQWKLPKLANVICLDVETEQPAAEPIDRDMVRGFWDRVSEEGADRISAGGFTSSYTGEAFSDYEVEEYVSRAVKLAEPFLSPEKRALEIGCGAGIIMLELAPKVGQYVGLDPSEVTQERNRQRITDRGISNIELVTGFAHEISAMEAGSFDLVVIASAAQFFPGPLYFQQVISELLRLLAPGGRILLADILDARRKEEFRESLMEFQSNHPGAKTKTDLDSELYFDEDYFRDLKAKHDQIAGLEVLYRSAGYRNELGFRYDVLIEKVASRTGPVEISNRTKRKNLRTRWHLRQLPEENPRNRVTSDDLAYIIFTSGSTGVPKGIAVNHKAVVNVINWVNKTYRVGPGDELLFVTSLCFDLSVYDIFGILAAGATIHVASRADLEDAKRLVEKLCNGGITCWDSAPAALQQLAPLFPTDDSTNENHPLRLVLLSGDWIPLSLPDQVRVAFPGAQVISFGGATEAAIWSNSYPVNDIKPEWASIPYGKPIQNARYYILDEYENLCPVGVPGQLFIGGDCLALGYTDPILTAEKFAPAPFGDQAGARLYKTGDCARWWPDGNIEFLGRIDHQVKVRGFRIELGEIESALAKHPAAVESLVIAREHAPGNKRLVAYMTLRQGQTVTINELRRFLKQKLPDYMVPSAFVFLDSMPLTRNGKIDREKLPDPRSDGADAGASFIAPRSELEKAIAVIWQEILGAAHVSAYDNFFDLGGHSLLMIQVYARLREFLKRDLSIIEMFKYPTVSSLAEYLSLQKEPSSSRPEQDRGKARRHSIASHAQFRKEIKHHDISVAED